MEPYRKYFTTVETADKCPGEPDWGFEIMNIGHHIHLPYQPYPDQAHPEPYSFDWAEGRVLNEYQLIYIASGTGVFESESLGMVAVKPGSVFLIAPGLWHRYTPTFECGWEEYWIGFKGHYPEYLMKQECFNKYNLLTNIGLNSEFVMVFGKLFESLKSDRAPISRIFSCGVMQLLGIAYSATLFNDKQQNRKEDIVNNLKLKIQEQWSKQIQIKDLAKQYHVSYTWLRRSFRELSGISPGQYHLNLKLEKACQMLAGSDMTISEIAFTTGFATEFHFSRIFKKKMSMTPSKYRFELNKIPNLFLNNYEKVAS
ncbi:MAG: AraC family transcriptional regulator [Mucilaginibacter sp.]|nr:AraC family transcriptional regulator [Mucilaginibacter sp.]